MRLQSFPPNEEDKGRRQVMNYDVLFAVIFYIGILIFFFARRDHFQVQAKIFAIYRTRLGLKLMETLANLSRRFWHLTGVLAILSGFCGMLFIFVWLIKGTLELIFVPDALPAIAPVLPGVKILPGLPVLSFWHWIIAIFIVAVVHEFCHGIFSRVYDVKIKSSGFAFLGPILAAFVEPDEKQLGKKSKRAQLAVFSAGPFSNLVMGLAFIAVLNFVSGPVYEKFYESDGIIVNKVVDNHPAAKSGMTAPIVITEVNGKETRSLEKFIEAINNLEPGEEVVVGTDKGKFSMRSVENPKNQSKAFIGIAEMDVKTKVREGMLARYGTLLPKIIAWLHLLVFWMIVVNLGVGLFNLLPLGPVDGGRMFLTLSLAIFNNNQVKAKKFWASVTFFCLVLIFINLLPYLWKLLVFVTKPVVLLFGV